jgi:D-proline reductase (dithiol) PrdB
MTARAPEFDQPVRYIERTRSWYQTLGYPNAYRWVHYLEVPFTLLRKPLAHC